MNKKRLMIAGVLAGLLALTAMGTALAAGPGGHGKGQADLPPAAQAPVRQAPAQESNFFGVERAAERVQEAFNRQAGRLQEVLGRAPDQAKGRIQEAIARMEARLQQLLENIRSNGSAPQQAPSPAVPEA